MQPHLNNVTRNDKSDRCFTGVFTENGPHEKIFREGCRRRYRATLCSCSDLPRNDIVFAIALGQLNRVVRIMLKALNSDLSVTKSSMASTVSRTVPSRFPSRPPIPPIRLKLSKFMAVKAASIHANHGTGRARLPSRLILLISTAEWRLSETCWNVCNAKYFDYI